MRFFRDSWAAVTQFATEKFWAAVAALATLAAALAAGYAAYIAKQAAQDAREAIAREDAPAIFLDCEAVNAKKGRPAITYLLADDLRVYETLHRWPPPALSMPLPTHLYTCTASNAGKLPATNILIAFDVYYSDSDVFSRGQKFVYDLLEIPQYSGALAGSGTINLAPGATFSFAMQNLTVVHAWVSPIQKALISEPAAANPTSTCVPLYLGARTFLTGGILPSPRKRPSAHALPYDVPRLAKSGVVELAPPSPSPCFANVTRPNGPWP